MKTLAIISVVASLAIHFFAGLFCFHYSDSRILHVAYGRADWTDRACDIGLAVFWWPLGPFSAFVCALVIYYAGRHILRSSHEHSTANAA